MNSFQKWADDYARAHGFVVTLTGNWVELHKGDISETCMSAQGVQSVCDRDKNGVTLAHDPNRPWFPA